MYDDRTKMAGLDVISAIGLFIFGAGMAYISYTMKIYNRNMLVSPGLFPLILGCMFMFLGILLGYFALRRNGWKAAGYMLSSGHLNACLTSPRFSRGAVVLLSIVAYVILFGRIHFIAITCLYLLFTFIYLKAMRPSYAVLVSAVAAIVIFCVFKFVFGIPMP